MYIYICVYIYIICIYIYIYIILIWYFSINPHEIPMAYGWYIKLTWVPVVLPAAPDSACPVRPGGDRTWGFVQGTFQGTFPYNQNKTKTAIMKNYAKMIIEDNRIYIYKHVNYRFINWTWELTNKKGDFTMKNKGFQRIKNGASPSDRWIDIVSLLHGRRKVQIINEA